MSIITKTSNKPFEKCALDIVGSFSITTLGNKLLIFQDDLTKFSYSAKQSYSNQEATMGIKELITKIICEYGIPETVLADQGTNFLSEVFKNVY